MRLDGKVAVVTGGGSGFGAGIVQLFAAEGARVVVADVNERAAKEVAAGIDAVAVAADVTREDDTKRMIDAAIGRFGRLDILVNNAGVTHVNQPLTEVSEADFDRVFAVNVKAIYWAARNAVPVFRPGRWGDHQHREHGRYPPAPGLTWYNGNKGGGDHHHQVDGGRARTRQDPRERALPGRGRDTVAGVVHGRRHGRAPRPLHRYRAAGSLSTPLDVARAALWLASEDAGFITGVALEVDGGRCV